MKRSKIFEVKNGNIFYRCQLEFKNIFHELYWRAIMKTKGRVVKEIHIDNYGDNSSGHLI